MKIGIVGASSESVHSIEVAQKMGIEVVAFDGNEKAEGLAVADAGIVVNISNESATIEAVKKENVDFLVTVPIGRYLTTIGAVNDALSLKGITKQSAVLCTDKYLFHQQLQKEGLRDCDCYLINREREIGDCEYGKITFPAILKPRYGSGSRAIYFLDNQEQLEEAITEVIQLDEDFVLEQAVSGIEYGVDGAVVDGVFQLILLRKKINTPPPARQAVGYLAQLPEKNKELYEQVNQQLQKIVTSLGLTDCLFHADLMIDKKGDFLNSKLVDKEKYENKVYDIFVIELSARPSGHYLHNVFTPLATGVDMAKEYMNYMQGVDYSFVPQMSDKQLLIHFFDLPEGKVTKVPKENEIQEALDCKLLKWNCNIKEVDVLESVTNGHSVMGRGYFIIEGKEESEILQMANRILKEEFEIILTDKKK